MAAALLARLTGSPAVDELAWATLLAVVVLGLPGFGLREGYLVTLCAVLSALATALHPDPSGVIARAMDQAVFLMSFVLLLGLINEAASTSPAVVDSGAFLTRQPPGRRFYALYLGTGFLGVLFNLGLVGFLVPLIQRGVAAARQDDGMNPVRERRQISAMLRGFAWSVIWSPTALAPLALMELMPQADRGRWMALGFAAFLVMMVAGAVEDRISVRKLTRRPGPQPSATVPGAALLRLAAACGWLLGLSLLLSWATQETAVFGLMLACPVMLVCWIAVQTGGDAAATLGRLRTVAMTRIPRSAPVAVTLGTSGFIGALAGALLPAEAVAETLGLGSMPDYLLLAAITVFVPLASLLAVSPVMMSVFLGTLFTSLPVLPADATLLALAISCGWSLSMTFSPFATIVLVAANASGIPPRRLTWGWNLRFTLVGATLMPPMFWVLTGGG